MPRATLPALCRHLHAPSAFWNELIAPLSPNCKTHTHRPTAGSGVPDHPAHPPARYPVRRRAQVHTCGRRCSRRPLLPRPPLLQSLRASLLQGRRPAEHGRGHRHHAWRHRRWRARTDVAASERRRGWLCAVGPGARAAAAHVAGGVRARRGKMGHNNASMPSRTSKLQYRRGRCARISAVLQCPRHGLC